MSQGVVLCPIPYKKVTLRLFAEKEPQNELCRELEVRAVTSADPLGGIKSKEKTWTPGRIRFEMQPTSRFLCHAPVKEGWVEVDVTEWANDVGNKPIQHGLRFSDTGGPAERFTQIHGPASKNPPQLVLEK